MQHHEARWLQLKLLSLPAALNTILSRTHKVETRRVAAVQLAIFGIAVGVFKRERGTRSERCLSRDSGQLAGGPLNMSG